MNSTSGSATVHAARPIGGCCGRWWTNGCSIEVLSAAIQLNASSAPVAVGDWGAATVRGRHVLFAPAAKQSGGPSQARFAAEQPGRRAGDVNTAEGGRTRRRTTRRGRPGSSTTGARSSDTPSSGRTARPTRTDRPGPSSTRRTSRARSVTAPPSRMADDSTAQRGRTPCTRRAGRAPARRARNRNCSASATIHLLLGGATRRSPAPRRATRPGSRVQGGVQVRRGPVLQRQVRAELARPRAREAAEGSTAITGAAPTSRANCTA